MTIEIGKTPVLKTIRGIQLVYGRHDLLVQAIEDDLPLLVKDEDGHDWMVRIEHVSHPNHEDFAWAHPRGTRAPEQESQILEPRKYRTPRPRVRRHT